MTQIEKLHELFYNQRLNEIFTIRREDEYPEKEFSSLRFTSNNFRIRAIEIWQHPKGQFLRVYYSKNIAIDIKEAIDDIKGKISTAKSYSDFRADYSQVVKELVDLLLSDASITAAKNNPILTKNAAYEGLLLPDVDVSDINIL